MAEARQLGMLGMIASLFAWIYYTLWILVSPLLEPTHFL